MRKPIRNRILSGILAAAALISLFPLASQPPQEVAEPEQPDQSQTLVTPNRELPWDYDTLHITMHGEDADSLELRPNEKVEIKAAGLAEDATYQWQVQHPENDEVWVNIYDGIKQTISVSQALVANVLQKNGTAKLRCRAYTKDSAFMTGTFTVTMLQEMTVEPEPVYASQNVAAQADEPEIPEFVTVTIEYIKYDFKRDNQGKLVLEDGKPVYDEGKVAFTSYMATIRGGSPLQNTPVHFPTIVGYDAYWEDDTTPSTDYVFNLDSVNEDLTYRVSYKPALVNYTVRYFFQNVYDDLYVEDSSKKITDKGYTGATPPDSQLDVQVDGFTSLYHQPDAIAADGSTVFEVYYERNYYLMEFDCNGGYGTDTVYVRYGSHISVPNPTRPGYVFGNDGDGNGWDLVKTEQTPAPTLGDDIGDALPTTMPAYNSGYRAIWDTTSTTYSMVYWILDSDGNKTYIGSREIVATSGTTVSGAHDLDEGTFPICGSEEHTHSDACYICNAEEHKHTKAECFTSVTWTPNNPGNGLNAINDLEGEGGPETGYIYVIYSHLYGKYWPKLYLEDSNGTGTYYAPPNGIQGGTTKDSFSSIIDGEPIADKNGTYNGEELTVWKYKPKTDCGEIQHIHNNSCRTCQEHTHDALKCYQDEDRLVEVDSFTYEDENGDTVTIATDKNVTVLGDGSTVVNVYYEYKTYTFIFYYAKEVNGKYYVPGGSTWAFSGDENNIQNQLSAVNGIWGEVNDKPSLNTTAFNGATYHEYTINGVAGKYYYIQLTAKYNDDISTRWPANPFNGVKAVNPEVGDTAYFSAWNVDANTGYDGTHENKTLKGTYQLLDSQLLIDTSNGRADRTTLYYLAFWENAVDNVNWNYPHRWKYNLYIPAKDGTHEYGGVKYRLYGTYTIYDDNTYPSDKKYYGQTPTALEGYETPTYVAKDNGEYDTTNHLHDYQIDFYYTAKTHALKFYNKTDWLGDGSGATMSGGGTGIPYGTELKVYGDYVDEEYMKAHYPRNLEPGAYEFKGWYTSPGCYDGTEVDWETLTMPDADLTLYAKWEPIMRNVVFYPSYDDIQADEDDTSDKVYHFMKAENIPHGTTLGSTYLDTPEWPQDLDPALNGGALADMYDFVGWFYMDENGKKRFAPDSMEVNRDLVLFAEWQTSVDTTYEVQYVLAEDVKDKALPSGKDYLAGELVGDTIFAHSTVGKTKTFDAKGGADLYEDFQSHFFPKVNSHSILMEQDGEENKFVFQYLYDDIVYYKVRYVDYATRTEIGPKSKILTTDSAIITEKFYPIEGYLPQNYYITKALAYDGNATVPIEENVITFYYNKDTEHGLYSVEYYLENPNSTNSADPNNYYQYESIVGSDDINNEIVAQIRGYEGYTHVPSMNTVITFNPDGSVKSSLTNVQNQNGAPFGTVEYTGLTLKLYYKRNEYPYTIEYREYGSETLLKTMESAKAKFDTQKSHIAEPSFQQEGLTYEYYMDDADEAERTKTMTIRVPMADNPDTPQNEAYANKLVFYYKKHEVVIHYVPVCKTPDATGYGGLSFYNERVPTASAMNGSNAIAGEGFRFAGWYYDEDCTMEVPEAWVSDPDTTDGDATKTKLVPGTLDTLKSEESYYALFAPITTSLTIRKVTAVPDDMPNDDTFLFRIKGQGKHAYLEMTVAITVQDGNGSVTICDIPLDRYEITELTGWSWEYEISAEASQNIILVETGANNEVLFGNTYADPDWLGDECSKDNNFG